MNFEALQKLATEGEKMVPLYREKPMPSLKAFVTHLEWNPRKLKGEAGPDRIEEDKWARHTADDLANISLCLAKEESGQALAARFDAKVASRRKVAKALGLSDAEIASVGSEEGNELLRTHLIGGLAANRGALPFDAACIA